MCGNMKSFIVWVFMYGCVSRGYVGAIYVCPNFTEGLCSQRNDSTFMSHLCVAVFAGLCSVSHMFIPMRNQTEISDMFNL